MEQNKSTEMSNLVYETLRYPTGRVFESDDSTGSGIPDISLGTSVGRRWTCDQDEASSTGSLGVPGTAHEMSVGREWSCDQDELSEWFNYVDTYWKLESSQSLDDDDWKDYSGCDEEEQDSGDKKKGNDDWWDAGALKDQMPGYQDHGHQDHELEDVDKDWIYHWSDQVWQD